MIPIKKQIINNKQKRAALVGCTLFAFMGLMVAMRFLFYVLGSEGAISAFSGNYLRKI